jgi:uncharacterized protein
MSTSQRVSRGFYEMRWGLVLMTSALLIFCLTAVGMAGAEDGDAQTRGVNAYYDGDYATAMRLIRPLAEEGHPTLQALVGIMYKNGQGVRQDYAEANKWLRLSASQGSGIGQYSLGLSYSNGTGVPQDYAEALRLFRLSANQGNPQAQGQLGFAYLQGRGVDQNDAEAAKWFRLSAEQGESLSQSFLGMMYLAGRGVTQDYVQAHVWSNLAASHLSGGVRDEAVRVRDTAASKMTPEQIVEAQRLAREWKPTRP